MAYCYITVRFGVFFLRGDHDERTSAEQSTSEEGQNSQLTLGSRLIHDPFFKQQMDSLDIEHREVHPEYADEHHNCDAQHLFLVW